MRPHPRSSTRARRSQRVRQRDSREHRPPTSPCVLGESAVRSERSPRGRRGSVTAQCAPSATSHRGQARARVVVPHRDEGEGKSSTLHANGSAARRRRRHPARQESLLGRSPRRTSAERIALVPGGKANIRGADVEEKPPARHVGPALARPAPRSMCYARYRSPGVSAGAKRAPCRAASSSSSDRASAVASRTLRSSTRAPRRGG